MKIKEILKKQGEIYKNLTSYKTIQECNETFKPKLVPYRNHKIWNYEYEAIKGLENLLEIEPVIVDKRSGDENNFEISIKNNKIIYLSIFDINLTEIPEQINKLKNLKRLDISYNKITKIENIDNLQNLQIINFLDNQITKIENLDNLHSLEEVALYLNPIKNREEIKNLREIGPKIYIERNPK